MEATRQIKLVQFMKQYSMSRTTLYRLMHRQHNPFPAYKIGGDYYVDIAKFEAWRETETDLNTR